MPTTAPPAPTPASPLQTHNRPQAQIASRIAKLTSHLSPPTPAPRPLTLQHQPPAATASTAAMAQQPARPPITCHVLDTTAGRPGAGIPVTLSLLPSPTGSSSSSTSSTSPVASFTSFTNSDGRVVAWTPASLPSSPFTEPPALESIFKSEGNDGADEHQRWVLRFETEKYWRDRGVQPFFGEVDVRFVCRKEQRVAGEHFHVPVLLGPYNYTTYRGS